MNVLTTIIFGLVIGTMIIAFAFMLAHLMFLVLAVAFAFLVVAIIYYANLAFSPWQYFTIHETSSGEIIGAVKAKDQLRAEDKVYASNKYQNYFLTQITKEEYRSIKC